MRLGGQVFAEYSDPDGWIAALRDYGYSAAYCPVQSEDDAATVQAYANAAKEADVIIAEVGVWSNPLSPDEKTRRAVLALAYQLLSGLEKVLHVSCGR